MVRARWFRGPRRQKLCSLYACACLVRAVNLRSVDVWIYAQPFLVSAVCYDSGELGFSSMPVRGMYSLAFVGLPYPNPSPTGSMEHFLALLIPQYVLMPFTMTGLVVYTLNYLF